MSAPSQDMKEMDEKFQRNVIANFNACATSVVQQLIAHSLEKKVDVLFDTVVLRTTALPIEEKNNETVMTLALMPKDYIAEEITNGLRVGGIECYNLIYLIHMAKRAYLTIRADMLSRNITTLTNEVLLFDPLNFNLYIDSNSEKRISIIYVSRRI